MIVLNKGESRIIGIEISARDRANFEITESTYELYRLVNNRLVCVSEGICDILGKNAQIQVNADETGIYVIKFINIILGERVIKKVEFLVE